MQGTQVWSLGQEDSLEKGMATHSSILAWRIPGMEEPGRLQSMGSRVRHDWVTNNNSIGYIQTLHIDLYKGPEHAQIWVSACGGGRGVGSWNQSPMDMEVQ